MTIKKTKIVATIGPSSDNKEILKAMIEAGMNVARINFSHGTYEAHKKIISLIRELSIEIGRPIGILADLQGPRIRVGNSEPFDVSAGEVILISDKKTINENEKELIIDSDRVSSALQAGERILIEDGLLSLEVIGRNKGMVTAKVINGGKIKPRKGINIPDTKLHFGAVTEKDRRDLEFALSNEVDFVALSFVSNGNEIKEMRENIKKILGRDDKLPLIVAKIERSEAIKNLEEIIAAADVVMVARGDLGIEMDESRVVIYQKEIIAKCLEKVKPVIVATQMLESMINNSLPTRAEVSDVTNAVIDHTDAVMLSGETANGKYPVETIKIMSRIILNTENSPFDDIVLDKYIPSDYASIIASAHKLAKETRAKAIMMFSDSGYAARIMSHYRPEQIIAVAVTNEKTYQQLSIVWGVMSYLCESNLEREELIDVITKKIKEGGEISSGDKIVVILGKYGKSKDVMLLGVKDVE